MKMLRAMAISDKDKQASPKHWNDLVLAVARKRDRQAFQALFAHFAPLVKAYAYKVSDLAQADSLAEELMQETMVKVWLKAHTYNPQKSAASTWIFTIARNTRIDLLRKNAKQWESNNEDFDENALSAEDIWADQQDNDVLESVSEEHEQERILEMINKLPEDQITIVKTIFLEGLSHTEASEQLGLPLGTVKSRVRLALQKLKLTIDV
ncbi:MAG: RNA polymerase subunit sigma-70 [Gammaproteobacteria bacterium]|nr:RNA polymerase subunit sigma-70 [Gammaproteobacteria bacterium]MAY01913.1 RNA polymerase subunit sigma-70 [Gammaproteobacteria bacterium]